MYETSPATSRVTTLSELKQILDSFPPDERNEILAAIRDVFNELPSACPCLVKAAAR